jgi:hypothetical protein
MREKWTPGVFAERFAGMFTRSAFRLETLDFYVSEQETEPFRCFMAGETQDVTWLHGWWDLIQEKAAAGATMSRVHVIREPLSDYLRFELGVLNAASARNGEDVRVLLGASPRSFGPDFWLLDDLLVTMIYDPAGNWLAVEVDDDPATVQAHRARRDLLLQQATPLQQYPIQVERKTA